MAHNIYLSVGLILKMIPKSVKFFVLGYVFRLLVVLPKAAWHVINNLLGEMTFMNTSVCAENVTKKGEKVFLVLISLFSISSANSGSSEPVYEFKIPSQSLEMALLQYSNKVNIQILFNTEDVEGINAKGIKGTYSKKGAIQKILDGTGLVFKFTSLNTLIVRSDKKNIVNKKSLAALFGLAMGISSASQAFADDTDYSKQNMRTLEEVIVTAQKRQENVQDAALAITAISGHDLEARNFESLFDLNQFSPSVISGQIGGMNRLFIRGIGMSSLAEGNDPSSAFHVDGIYVGRPSAQLTSMFDIDRIEIVRGPQGTLYGRNATGGAVNVITRKPTEDFEGYISASFGNYKSQKYDGAISGPLNKLKTVLGRLAVSVSKNDGYVQNEYLNRKTEDQDSYGLRGTLDWDLSPSANILLSAEYSNEDDENYAAAPFGAYPGFTLFSDTVPGLPKAIVGVRDKTSVSMINVNKREFSSLGGTLALDISENWIFKSITGWRRAAYDNTYDSDNGPVTNVGDFYADTKAEQFSEEIQFSYDSDKLQFIAGLFYFDEKVDVDRRVKFDTFFGPGNTYNPKGKMDIETWAVFSQVTYSLAQKFRLTAGGRYSAEKRYHDGAFQGADNSVPPVIVVQDKSWGDFTPKLGVEYDLSDQMLLFVSYTEGFKSGSFNIGENNDDGNGNHFYDPEFITAYEVGLKGSTYDDRLRFSLTGFYYDYEDLQLNKVIGISTRTVNAATAKNKGIEFEIQSFVGENFLLQADLSYLDAEFTEFDAINPLTGLSEDLSGNKLPGSMEWTANLGFEWTIPVKIEGSLILNVHANYVSDRYFSEFNDPVIGQDAVTRYNSSLNYSDPAGRYTLSLWGKNLSNENVASNKFLGVDAFGFPIVGSWYPPRTYGVKLKFNF